AWARKTRSALGRGRVLHAHATMTFAAMVMLVATFAVTAFHAGTVEGAHALAVKDLLLFGVELGIEALHVLKTLVQCCFAYGHACLHLVEAFRRAQLGPVGAFALTPLAMRGLGRVHARHKGLPCGFLLWAEVQIGLEPGLAFGHPCLHAL